MNLKKEHIIFRLLTVVLVVTLWVPSAIKLIHVFEHHEHQVCVSENVTHIHKVDLDCEFQKFQITNHFLNALHNFDSTLLNHPRKVTFLTYKFLNNHRPLSYSLRGPPVLV